LTDGDPRWPLVDRDVLALHRPDNLGSPGVHIDFAIVREAFGESDARLLIKFAFGLLGGLGLGAGDDDDCDRAKKRGASGFSGHGGLLPY